MWVGLVQWIRTKLSNTARAEVNNQMADVHVEELSRFKCLLRIIYVSKKQLTVFKNMTIIRVEIVRMTLDAFWSEKSTICQRNISPLVPRHTSMLKKNHKNKSSQWI